ncbi:hypothetical protein OSJ57_23280 [Sphingomonas sp. HH69]
MSIEPSPHHHERVRLESLIGIAEKRAGRAAEKRRAAEREVDEALDALDAASRNLRQWIAANPDPQGELL